MDLSEITARLENAVPSETGWRAACPVCGSPDSLECWATPEGGAALRCMNGCRTGAVCKALGIRAQDLLPPGAVDKRGRKRTVRAVVECFVYEYAAGLPGYRVQVREDGSRSLGVWSPEQKKWLYGFTRHRVQEVPYRLPEFNPLPIGRRVYICPSERDADALRSLGVIATAFLQVGGEGRFGGWRDEFAAYFRGGSVVVLARRDDGPSDDSRAAALEAYAGQVEADMIYQALSAVCASCVCLALPDVGAAEVRCPAEFVAAGGTADALAAAVAAAPEWHCPDPLERLAAKMRGSANQVSGGAQPPRVDAANAATENKPGAKRPDGGGASVSPRPRAPDEVLGTVEIVVNHRQIHVDLDADLREVIEAGTGEYSTYTDQYGDEKTRKLGGVERQQVHSEIAVCWLGAHGKYYYNSEPGKTGFETDMYFDQRTKKLHIVHSDVFTSLVSHESGVNWSLGEYRFLEARIHNEILSSGRGTGARPAKYWCNSGGRVYVSCGEGQMCKCGGGKVEIVDNGTDGVLFDSRHVLRAWNLVALDEACDPFESCGLFANAHYSAEYGKILTKLWLLNAMCGWRKKPPLVFTGHGRSGKTALAMGLFALLGMEENVAMVANGEKSCESFSIAVDNGGLVCVDNLDDNIKWIPTVVEGMATGGQLLNRVLYKQELGRYRANASLVITSAENRFAGRYTLSDRLVIVRLTPWQDGESTKSGALDSEIEAKRDSALSWLCRVIALALADTDGVPENLNQRFPDWAAFAYRCGRVMDQASEAELAIRGAETDKAIYNLESNFLGKLLIEVFSDPDEKWVGTATELFATLKERVKSLNERELNELSADRIGRQLASIWPHVAAYFNGAKRVIRGRAEYTLIGRSPAGAVVDVVDVEGQDSESHVRAQARVITKSTSPRPPRPPSTPSEEEELEF